MAQAARSLITVAASAAAARLGLRAARRATRGAAARGTLLDERRWARTNHRGEPVTLLEGPVYAAAAAAAVLAAPGLPGRLRTAGVAAAVGAGAFGVYDDLYGNADRRGIKGHLTALTQGEVTTGGVKIVGIGAVGVLGGALARRGGSVTDKALAAVVIAGAANAVNLLDLRPGRAIKGAALVAGPGVLGRALRGTSDGVSSGRSAGNGSGMAGSANTLAAAGLGAAVALLPEDLGERAMLGDSGANALGALLGLAAAIGARSTAGLAWRAAALTAVTLASEKVSFTKVIAGNQTLNAIDMWGRRPAAPAVSVDDSATDDAVGEASVTADAAAIDSAASAATSADGATSGVAPSADSSAEDAAADSTDSSVDDVVASDGDLTGPASSSDASADGEGPAAWADSFAEGAAADSTNSSVDDVVASDGDLTGPASSSDASADGEGPAASGSGLRG